MSNTIKKYLHDIDLQTNQLLNARLHPLTSAERIALGNTYNTGDLGVLVFDITDKVFYVWDGSAWYPFSVSQALYLQIQQAYDKYTKTVNITSTETVHTVQLISRDDTFIQDTIVYSHIHTQTTASSQWTVTHNLGKFPSVTIVDSANMKVIGDIQYVSNNQVIIRFSEAFSGKAFIN